MLFAYISLSVDFEFSREKNNILLKYLEKFRYSLNLNQWIVINYPIAYLALDNQWNSTKEGRMLEYIIKILNICKLISIFQYHIHKIYALKQGLLNHIIKIRLRV